MSIKIKPVKVIHMASLGPGGLSKLTVSIHENIDTSRVQFEYLCFKNEKEFFEERILSLGGKKQIIDTTAMKNPITKAIKKIVLMKRLFKKENYDVVHVDASSPYDVFVALSAKMAGINIIVLHSHTDGKGKNKVVRNMFNSLYKRLMLITVTDYITISQSAADFMFPKKILKNNAYITAKNGIQLDKYLYSNTERDKIRRKLNLYNKFVVGHVGRFVYQKNHEFIIETFSKLHKKHPESVLLLVGVGELLDEMKDKVNKMGLSDSVVFYGVTHDLGNVLSAMDIFIFPSHVEGLGIVAIEAQCTGLPICCADTIVEEANITNLFHRVNGWNTDLWAENLWEKGHSKEERKSHTQEIIDAGYDINILAKELENWYVQKSNSLKDRE